MHNPNNLLALNNDQVPTGVQENNTPGSQWEVLVIINHSTYIVITISVPITLYWTSFPIFFNNVNWLFIFNSF